MVFAALVGMRWHGYSLPLWHSALDGSAPEGIVAGELRPLRTDDWLVGLPLSLAQAHHEPAFPRVNTSIGLGQDVILTDIPIRHWSALFRPFSWGFFLGDDLGVAWMWWSQLLGFAAVTFALLRLVAPGRDALAAAGALLLLASPFLQFWALLPSRFMVYAGLGVLGAHGILQARTPRQSAPHAVLLAWGLGCLGLALYPPYQLPLAQLAVVLVAGLAWERRAALRARPLLPLVGFASAAAASVAIGVGFALDAGPTLERMLATAYPGERVSLGGDLVFWRIFSHALLLGSRVDDWSPVLNIAEGASFWLFFPVSGAVALLRAWRGRPDPLSLALLAYATLLLVYSTLGLPNFLAKATGLSWAQPTRTLIALGLADTLLLVRVLATAPSEPPARGFVAAVVCGWVALLTLVSREVNHAFGEVGSAWLVGACLANALVAAGIVRGWRPARLVAGAALALLATTFWYNPLVRGGTAFLSENPLSRKIVALDEAAGGKSLGISYGPPYAANLFRVIGVRAITGVQSVPQLELWRALDPNRKYERIYNRYAHVTARSAGTPGVRFRLPAPDSFELIVEPGAPELRALGLTHALIVAPQPPQLPGARHVDSHAWNHLYELGADDAAR